MIGAAGRIEQRQQTSFLVLLARMDDAFASVGRQLDAIRATLNTMHAKLDTLLKRVTPLTTDRRHQLRAPIGDFVGRTDELEMLVQALCRPNGTAAIIGVRGMGGMGKTELAYLVAHRVRHHFPDAQIVVPLAGTTPNRLTPEQALQAVIRDFKPEAKLPDDLPTLTRDYSACLDGQRALILADDAYDAAQVRSLLPPAGCALLLTSRQLFTLPGMQSIDLGLLAADEAATLLRQIAPRIGTHAPELARLCGYLPLALRISADLLANDDTRALPRYLADLEAERLRHLTDPDGHPDDPAASVEASLRLSYAALPAEAQTTLAQLGVFVGTFTPAAAAAVVSETPTPLADTLSLLRRRSLLEYDPASERYDLHDLVRAFALRHLPADRPVRLCHARYYQRVADRADALYLEGNERLLEGLALFDCLTASGSRLM